MVGCCEIVHHREMRALKIRELTQEEMPALKRGVRSPQAFTVRRSQILLASNEGHTAPQIAAQLHCSDQCVREAIHAFDTEGLSCLSGKSHATHTDQSAIDETGRDRLEELLHQSPRHFGQDTSVWMMDVNYYGRRTTITLAGSPPVFADLGRCLGVVAVRLPCGSSVRRTRG